MADAKLVNFENTFFETNQEIGSENPDALAKITIDGYPKDENTSGRVICEIYVTNHGDIITTWRERAYKDDIQKLLNDSKQKLLDAYQHTCHKKAGCNMNITIPEKGMLCVPLDNPNDKFYLKPDGSQTYEKDFVKTALSRYCALYVYEQRVDIGEMLLAANGDDIYNSTSENPADQQLFQVYRYILRRRGKDSQYTKTDKELLQEFTKNEYREQRIMEAALAKTELAIWKHFNNR